MKVVRKQFVIPLGEDDDDYKVIEETPDLCHA